MTPRRPGPAQDAGIARARIRVTRPTLPSIERFAESLASVWTSGVLSNDGPQVQALEAAFRAYSRVGAPVFAAVNADVALTLALAALDLPRSGVVALPSLGHPSTVHAVEWNGLRPRFLDVDSTDWCMHPEQLEGQLDGVVLILATHLFGVPCDVRGLARVAAASGARLVFDAAHAMATWIDGSHVVEHGDASTVSLGATKVITAAEGGLAVVREPTAARRFELLRTYGLDAERTSRLTGLNAKMSELHAALGVLALEGLEGEVDRRREILALYEDQLGAVEGVTLQGTPPETRPTPSYFVVDVGAARERVRQALAARDIDTRLYFPPLHLMPRFAAGTSPPLPVTERLGRSLLALPLYSGLSEAEVREICGVLVSSVRGSHSDDGK